jgi:hypothetical protein
MMAQPLIQTLPASSSCSPSRCSVVINGLGLEPPWTQDPPLKGTNRQRLHIGQVIAYGEASIASVEAAAGPAVGLAFVDQDQAPVGHTC